MSESTSAWSRAAATASAVAKGVATFLRRWDKDALERAEIDARKAERRLRDAIDALPEGVVFLDNEGRYILWNERYAEIYHRSADLFARGRRLVDTLRIGVARGDYPDALGREEAWLAERIALLENPGLRHEQRLSDGRWLMIEERRTGDGGTIGLRVDITEMKAQQQALRQALARAEAANRAKSDFLANMSHEIRTPLNGVLGLASVLDRGRLDPDQREIVGTIIASANTLNDLLGDLLTFARLESGRLVLTREPFSLCETIEQTATLFRAEAASKGLALELHLAEEAKETVLGDSGRLKQVLANLLSNALKFTAEGRIVVRLFVEGRGETRRHVLEVQDTGIGFDPDDAERLFLRFEQADSSITRKYGGTGLGLAICRQLADLMGGTIRASAQPGKGATFRLELPLEPAVAPAEHANEPEVTSEDTAETPSSLRILVAEDNPTNRKVAELMLGAMGVETECVENGALAVEAARQGRYDLGLIDIQMPVMDGLEAIRRIRAEERASGGPRLPLVVLSANVMPEHLAASRAAGADNHIGKPVRAEELAAAIAGALQDGEGDGEGLAKAG